MKILAIDPASRTGWAWSDGTASHAGVWNLGSGELRLQILDEKITQAIEVYGCEVIAFESATFGSHHAHVQRRHNELAAVVQLVAVREQVKCWQFNPMQWKKTALGKGNLDKQGVMRMLRLAYGIEVADADIADAIGILKAAERGPPPESQRKQRRRAEKRLRQLPRLF